MWRVCVDIYLENLRTIFSVYYNSIFFSIVSIFDLLNVMGIEMHNIVCEIYIHL